ncbi:hypothetical protein CapIbe_012190 [Capra ibex]
METWVQVSHGSFPAVHLESRSPLHGQLLDGHPLSFKGRCDLPSRGDSERKEDFVKTEAKERFSKQRRPCRKKSTD